MDNTSLQTLRVVLASDHAGYAAKAQLLSDLIASGELNKEHIEDVGCHSLDSCDYPDFALPAARAVAHKEADFGILICGSGIGMSISANKVHGVRASLVNSPEQAAITRQHNNSNILCLGARDHEPEDILKMVKTFLLTNFEGGRHVRRLEKIAAYERGH
jgi:ribose 5-phosphate isomerase B